MKHQYSKTVNHKKSQGQKSTQHKVSQPQGRVALQPIQTNSQIEAAEPSSTANQLIQGIQEQCQMLQNIQPMHRRSLPNTLSATKSKTNSTFKESPGKDSLLAKDTYSNPYREQHVTIETNSTQKSNLQGENITAQKSYSDFEIGNTDRVDSMQKDKHDQYGYQSYQFINGKEHKIVDYRVDPSNENSSRNNMQMENDGVNANDYGYIGVQENEMKNNDVQLRSYEHEENEAVTTNSKTGSQGYYVDDNDDEEDDDNENGSNSKLIDQNQVQIVHNDDQHYQLTEQEQNQLRFLQLLPPIEYQGHSEPDLQLQHYEQVHMLPNQYPNVHMQNYDEYQIDDENNKQMEMDGQQQEYMSTSNQHQSVTLPAGAHYPNGDERLSNNYQDYSRNQGQNSFNVMINQQSSVQSQNDYFAYQGSQSSQNNRKKPAAISPQFRHLQPKDYQKYSEMPARSMQNYAQPRQKTATGSDYGHQSNKSHRSSQHQRSLQQDYNQPQPVSGTTFGKEKRGLLVKEQEQLAASDQRKSLLSTNRRINLLNQSMHSQVSNGHSSYNGNSSITNRDYNNSSMSRSKSRRRKSQTLKQELEEMNKQQRDDVGYLSQSRDDTSYQSINLNINNNQEEEQNERLLSQDEQAKSIYVDDDDSQNHSSVIESLTNFNAKESNELMQPQSDNQSSAIDHRKPDQEIDQLQIDLTQNMQLKTVEDTVFSPLQSQSNTASANGAFHQQTSSYGSEPHSGLTQSQKVRVNNIEQRLHEHEINLKQKHQRYLAQNPQKNSSQSSNEIQSQNGYNSLRMVKPGRMPEAQRLCDQNGEYKNQDLADNCTMNNMLEVRHTQSNSLMTAQFQMTDNGQNGFPYGFEEGHCQAQSNSMQGHEYGYQQYDTDINDAIAQIGQVDVDPDGDDGGEHAHHIKIFEPEMAASDGMNTQPFDNLVEANHQMNNDLAGGDQCMSYSEYTQKQKSKEHVKNLTQKQTKSLNKKCKTASDAPNAVNPSKSSFSPQMVSSREKFSQMPRQFTYALGQYNSALDRAPPARPSDITRKGRKIKSSLGRHHQYHTLQAKFESKRTSHGQFDQYGGQEQRFNQTIMNNQPYAKKRLSLGKRSNNSKSVLTTQSSNTQSQQCFGSANQKRGHSRKQSKRMSSAHDGVQCAQQVDGSQLDPDVPQWVDVKGNENIHYDNKMSPNNKELAAFQQFAELTQETQVDQMEILPEDQNCQEHQYADSHLINHQMIEIGQHQLHQRKEDHQNDSTLQEMRLLEHQEGLPPQDQQERFYNPLLDDQAAEGLIHRLEDDNHQVDHSQSASHKFSFSECNTSWSKPANAVDAQYNAHAFQSTKQEKEFDIDLYRSELATINEVPTMMTNVTNEMTCASPINSDHLRNPQLIQSKTFKHLYSNNDPKNYIIKNFDKSQPAKRFQHNTGCTGRSDAQQASSGNRSTSASRQRTANNTKKSSMQFNRSSISCPMGHLSEKQAAKMEQTLKSGRISQSSSTLKFNKGGNGISTNKQKPAFFDPQKATIVHNQASHKSKVQNLKSQYVNQKNNEKKAVVAQINALKKQIMQVKKIKASKHNNACVKFEQIKEVKKNLKKRKEQVLILENQKFSMMKEVNELIEDVDEISNLKDSLKSEIESEAQMICDIQMIGSKYKKLVTEQRREKEKLATEVKKMQKIITNLQQRKNTLAEDGNKLYDDFRETLVRDHEYRIKSIRQTHTQSPDHSIIEY